MIKSRSEMPVKEMIEIDLSGPDGNAFVLMGYASSFAKQLKLPGKKIVDEMMAGDYDNLLDVFDKYFGDIVILYK